MKPFNLPASFQKYGLFGILGVLLGIAVLSRMLGDTIFGVLFTPVFYDRIRWFSARKPAEPSDKPAEPSDKPGQKHQTEPLAP